MLEHLTAKTNFGYQVVPNKRHLCRKEKYLRIDTIFKPYSKTSASIIYNIIDIWLNNELNAEKISSKLKGIYNKDTIN